VIVGLNLYTLFVHKKFNMGIDFAGGMTTQIQIAPTAFTIGYTGERKADLLIDGSGLTLKVDKGEKVEDFSFKFETYDTVRALVSDLLKVEGITVNILNYADARADRILAVDHQETLVKGYVFTTNIRLAQPAEIFANIADVRLLLEPMQKPSVQNIGDPINQEFFIKLQQSELTSTQANATGEGAGTSEDEKSVIDTAEKKIKELLSTKFDSLSIIVKATEFIGPSFSQELLQGAIVAVFIGILLVLIYVTFRFKFDFGLGGIIALIHDVLVMIACIGLFQWEWNSTMIAAVLTIIGYSINDTIVIYDRIRENERLIHEQSMEMIINTSITQTLGRTIMTSLTVFIAVIPIAIFTSGTIQEFAKSMIVGVISGSYSTIFIASPIVLSYRNFFAKRKKAKLESTFGQKPDKAEKIMERPDTIVTGAEVSDAEVVNSGDAANPQVQGNTPGFTGGRFHKKKKKKR
jgi:preprotein translocase subunit SecF